MYIKCSIHALVHTVCMSVWRSVNCLYCICCVHGGVCAGNTVPFTSLDTFLIISVVHIFEFELLIQLSLN